MLGLVLITIYLSIMDAPSFDFSIEPAWFIDKRSEKAILNGANIFESKVNREDIVDATHIPFHHLAIITDLDGDGTNELLTITNDFTMKVRHIYILFYLFNDTNIIAVYRFLLLVVIQRSCPWASRTRHLPSDRSAFSPLG